MLASLRHGGRSMRVLAAGVLLATFSTSADPARPAGAPSAADAIKGYWQDIKTGKVDDAMSTYIDTFAIADAAAGKDDSITREQRDSAAKDLQGYLGVAYKQPQVAAAMKTAAVTIKSEQPAAGDNALADTTMIDYVVKVTEPKSAELENLAYVRKAADGWRIVDFKQSGGPLITEQLRTGWQAAHQKLPALTFDQYVHMMTTTLTRRASTGRGSATSRPAAPAR